MKIHFGIFDSGMNYGVSLLANLALKKGWQVDICQDSEVIKDADLVALSFMSFSRNKAFEVAKSAHKKGIKVIAGGIHASSCPEDLQNTGFFDGIIVGDGMGVFDKVLDSYDRLSGIIQGSPHADLALYTQRYFSHKQKTIMKKFKMVGILTSFGCPFNCFYCASNSSIGYISLPMKTIAENLKRAKQEFGIERVHFQDDLFAVNHRRLKELRQQLDGVSFAYNPPNVRPGMLSKEVAEELKLLGIEDVLIGVETASEKLLKFINKKATVKGVYHTAKICKEFDLKARVNLMVGFPTETKKDLEDTFEFVRKTLPQTVCLAVFTPFPKTYLWDYCVEYGHLPRDVDFEDYFTISDKELGGFRDPKRILKNVDYDMAFHYMAEMEKFTDAQKKDIITQGFRKAKGRWIVFGTGEYFCEIAQKAEGLPNYMGYYDFGTLGSLGFNVKMKPPYKFTTLPETIVVTMHKESRVYERIIKPFFKRLKFTGKVISVSSYKK